MSVLSGLVVLVLAEVLALVAVAERIGPLDAVGLLVLTSMCGPALARRAGVGGMRRAYSTLRSGTAVETEALDTLLRLVGALLVCVPGFLTDIAGLALWLAPVRSLVRHRLARRRAAALIDTAGAADAAWPLRPGDGPGPRGRGQRPSPRSEGPVVDAGSHPVEGPDRG